MHWDAEMMEVVKWEEFASKIKFTLPNYWTQAALNWGLAWNRKNCKKSIKIYCKMLSWQTSLFWSSKALVQQNPLSCPGGQASDRTGALQTREQCQAARGLYLLLHHFPPGWRERAWRCQDFGSGISDWNELDSPLTSDIGRRSPKLPRGWRHLPMTASTGGRTPLRAATCDVPIEARQPLKLRVLWGMPNKGLQSFQKAEFLGDYPNQISESFEDGLSLRRGSVLQGNERSCNCLTSF